MTDELDSLIARVGDPALRTDLRAHIDRIRAKRTFGLVFESHLPERVRLPEHPIRVGARVLIRDEPRSAVYQVLRVHNGKAAIGMVRHPDGSRLLADEQADAVEGHHDVGALVVIADFGEPIYPGLRHLGSVERGGDKPAHVVIKGENHHVLEALQFTHAGKVDCIYIDPPYNTGARDWKYDNNYVDDSDAYRHSKWLAFMQRRLLLAKQLMNTERSVLIVTIDENELHRLGLLIEQCFPGSLTQVVSIVINPSGASRGGGLSRVEEYAIFCFVGESTPGALTTDLLDDREAGDAKAGSANVRWEWLLRGGGNWYREQRPNLCYPVVLNEEGDRIVGVGDPWAGDDETARPRQLDGKPLAWPVRGDGRLGIWRLEARRLMQLVEKGYSFVSDRPSARGTWTIRYLLAGTIAAVERGEIEVTGTGLRGQILVSGAHQRRAVPKTVWKAKRHIAGGSGGTQLLASLLGDRNRFTYPKSLYAVEDAVATAVIDNPEAVVLDFFGGSGTTAHAVARLNRQDGGHRRSIVVTNNEVSAAEGDALRKSGFRPGDPEWEALGIFEYVTRPRITAAVSGSRPDGEPVKGDYKFIDEFPMAEGFEENVEFVELTYLDPDDIELDLAFEAIAPLLWLRAGARGLVIDECLDSAQRRKPYAWTDQYGVLFNPDRWRGFVRKLPATATTAFVVTDSQATFAGVAAELPGHLDVVRLYENYLTTFRINEGRV
jgi:adenine-specific DNA-methyltransferase